MIVRNRKTGREYQMSEADYNAAKANKLDKKFIVVSQGERTDFVPPEVSQVAPIVKQVPAAKAKKADK